MLHWTQLQKFLKLRLDKQFVSGIMQHSVERLFYNDKVSILDKAEQSKRNVYLLIASAEPLIAWQTERETDPQLSLCVTLREHAGHVANLFNWTVSMLHDKTLVSSRGYGDSVVSVSFSICKEGAINSSRWQEKVSHNLAALQWLTSSMRAIFIKMFSIVQLSSLSFCCLWFQLFNLCTTSNTFT